MNKICRDSPQLIEIGLIVLDVADNILQGIRMLFQDLVYNVAQLFGKCISAFVVRYIFGVPATALRPAARVMLGEF
jgi:hypothetical protein